MVKNFALASSVESRSFVQIRSMVFDLPLIETAALQLASGEWTVIQRAEPFWSGWRKQVTIAFGLSTLLLIPFGWLMAMRLSRPLQDLEKTALNLSLDNTHSTHKFLGSVEVRAAKAAILDMNNRLRDQSRERVRMVTAIAHDLRTPLTSLRIRAESAPIAQKEKMASDIKRMELMIREMLNFTQGLKNNMELVPVDLTELVRVCLEDIQVQNNITSVTIPNTCWVKGRPLELRRAIDNLIDNALKYAGNITIELSTNDTLAILVVSDRGPGIPEADLERVLSPFERGEQSRNRDTGGVGLGLTIVNEIALGHGGKFHLINRKGAGVIAKLELPFV